MGKYIEHYRFRRGQGNSMVCFITYFNKYTKAWLFEMLPNICIFMEHIYVQHCCHILPVYVYVHMLGGFSYSEILKTWLIFTHHW
jgi:hypothetical protein